MSQMEEFLKQVEAVQAKDEKVLVVTGKPGSGKSKLLREAAEAKGWDYVDTRLLITEEFLKLLPSERKEKAPEMLTEELTGCRRCSFPCSTLIPRASSMPWGKPIR